MSATDHNRRPARHALGEGGVILGIDPGLNVTGYGVMEVRAAQWRLVTAGDMRPPRARPLPERLALLYAALSKLIASYHPQTMVLEKVFTHHTYHTTASLIAHARGIACLAAEERGLVTAEYSPARVKQAVTGSGAATKEQVARMVAQRLPGVEASWSSDATDALALAIAHACMDVPRRRLPAGVLPT